MTALAAMVSDLAPLDLLGLYVAGTIAGLWAIFRY